MYFQNSGKSKKKKIMHFVYTLIMQKDEDM